MRHPVFRIRGLLATLGLAAVIGSIAGCAADSLTGESPAPPSFGKGSGGTTSGGTTTGFNAYVSCKVLPTQSAVFEVGHLGGTFAVDYVELTVPKGAIARGDVRRFRMTTPSGELASVIFTPDDNLGTIQFELPVKIKISYKHCVPPEKASKKVVYTTDENDASGFPTFLADVTLSDDKIAKEATGQTDHFSRYAVAW